MKRFGIENKDLSNEFVNQIFEDNNIDIKLSDKRKKLLALLIYISGIDNKDENGFFFVENSFLANTTGMTEKNVIIALRYFNKLGIIERIAGSRSKGASKYRFTIEENNSNNNSNIEENNSNNNSNIEENNSNNNSTDIDIESDIEKEKDIESDIIKIINNIIEEKINSFNQSFLKNLDDKNMRIEQLITSIIGELFNKNQELTSKVDELTNTVQILINTVKSLQDKSENSTLQTSTEKDDIKLETTQTSTENNNTKLETMQTSTEKEITTESLDKSPIVEERKKEISAKEKKTETSSVSTSNVSGGTTTNQSKDKPTERKEMASTMLPVFETDTKITTEQFNNLFQQLGTDRLLTNYYYKFVGDDCYIIRTKSAYDRNGSNHTIAKIDASIRKDEELDAEIERNCSGSLKSKQLRYEAVGLYAKNNIKSNNLDDFNDIPRCFVYDYAHGCCL